MAPLRRGRPTKRRRRVAAIDARRRRVAELRYLEGLKIPEISEKLKAEGFSGSSIAVTETDLLKMKKYLASPIVSPGEIRFSGAVRRLGNRFKELRIRGMTAQQIGKELKISTAMAEKMLRRLIEQEQNPYKKIMLQNPRMEPRRQRVAELRYGSKKLTVQEIAKKLKEEGWKGASHNTISHDLKEMERYMVTDVRMRVERNLVLELRLEGLTLEEIAKKMGINYKRASQLLGEAKPGLNKETRELLAKVEEGIRQRINRRISIGMKKRRKEKGAWGITKKK